MTRDDINDIVNAMCPNDADFEEACISPAYLKKELEALTLDQGPSSDAIDREELKKWLDMNFSFGGALRKIELFDRLDKELPSVAPTRKIGKWVEGCTAITGDGLAQTYDCSECGSYWFRKFKYCPNCGSFMESAE